MKKILLFLLLSFFWMTGYAQAVYFNGTPFVNGKESISLYSLENIDNYIVATVQIEALKKIKKLSYWCTPNTVLYLGSIKYSQVLGYLVNGRIEQCGYNYQWSWQDVPAGAKNYYKLVFKGNIPPGAHTTVSIIDEGETVFTMAVGNKFVSSYNFTNYPLNYPRKDYTSINTMDDAKRMIDQNNDGICGIYEIIGGKANYVLACIKDADGYKLVYLSFASDLSRQL